MLRETRYQIKKKLRRLGYPYAMSWRLAELYVPYVPDRRRKER
jgi:hypothetical protein